MLKHNYTQYKNEQSMIYLYKIKISYGGNDVTQKNLPIKMRFFSFVIQTTVSGRFPKIKLTKPTMVNHDSTNAKIETVTLYPFLKKSTSGNSTWSKISQSNLTTVLPNMLQYLEEDKYTLYKTHVPTF